MRIRLGTAQRLPFFTSSGGARFEVRLPSARAR